MEKIRIYANQLAFLQRELERWAADGIMPDEMRTEILGKYEKKDFGDGPQGVFFTILLSLGTLLLGAAALLLVSYNWKELSGCAKFSIIGSAMATSYAVGGWFSRRKNTTLSEIAYFLGALFYGVGIWQIAQVYHVAAYYPNGIFMWAVGVLALAIWLKTPILHALAAALLALWTAIEILGNVDFYSDGIDWFTIPTVWTPILAGLGWMSIRWGEKSEWGKETISTLYSLTLVEWLLLMPIWGKYELFPGAFYYILLGCAMFLAPQFTNRARVTKGVWQVVGAITMAIALIPLTFEDSWDSYINMEMGFVPILATAIFGGMATLFLRARRKWTLEEQKSNFFFWELALYAYLLLMLGVFGANCENLRLPFLVTQNIAMFLFGVIFIYRGMLKRSGGSLIFGTGYFLLWMLIRYIDLFGGDMLGAAGMFAFCALALFGASYFWFHSEKLK